MTLVRYNDEILPFIFVTQKIPHEFATTLHDSKIVSYINLLKSSASADVKRMILVSALFGPEVPLPKVRKVVVYEFTNCAKTKCVSANMTSFGSCVKAKTRIQRPMVSHIDRVLQRFHVTRAETEHFFCSDVTNLVEQVLTFLATNFITPTNKKPFDLVINNLELLEATGEGESDCEEQSWHNCVGSDRNKCQYLTCFKASADIECNEKCVESGDCGNCNLRSGDSWEHFKVENTTNTVITTKDIEPFTFIGEYAGTHLTAGDVRDLLQRDASKQFMLKSNENLFVDATEQGNFTRFISFSSIPNLQMFERSVMIQNERRMYPTFRSGADVIEANTVLTSNTVLNGRDIEGFLRAT